MVAPANRGAIRNGLACCGSAVEFCAPAMLFPVELLAPTCNLGSDKFILGVEIKGMKGTEYRPGPSIAGSAKSKVCGGLAIGELF